MFSSKSFTVSGLTVRPLIHFEFIFVHGVRNCSNFILLHVAVHFPQHHLLKRLPLPHCILLPPLSKNKVPIGVRVYFWAFNEVLMTCLYVCVKLLSILYVLGTDRLTAWMWLRAKAWGAGVCLLLTRVMWSIYITFLRFSVSLMQIWIFARTHWNNGCEVLPPYLAYG